jgi:FixJ family two-component response regulator
MPGLGGMDVLDSLRTAGEKLPVIIVTGRSALSMMRTYDRALASTA